MGDILNLRGQKMQKKPTKKEMLDQRVQILEQHMQGMIQEIWTINANAVTLFRALEERGAITEEDIKSAWDEHVKKPHEEAQRKMSEANSQGATANDQVATEGKEESSETEKEDN